MKRIAVLIVHGIETDDPEFAATPMRVLKQAFADRLGRGADPDEALVFQKAYWAPILEDQQRQLFQKEYPGARDGHAAHLRKVVQIVTAGSTEGLLPFAASFLRRTLHSVPGVHYPTARWVMMHFLGDAISYQMTPSSRESYDQIHEAYADALHALARRAGADAPLCVLSHSFGTIVSSDFFYDRETERQTGRPVAPRRELPDTPLERGETLTWFYTMGSPMALWSLRYPSATLDAPIAVPAREMRGHEELHGEWVNILDDDDLFAYPLRPLSPEYARAVAEDRRVAVRAAPFSWTPLVHPFYWADPRVMAPVGNRLAEAWKALNGAADVRRAS